MEGVAIYLLSFLTSTLDVVSRLWEREDDDKRKKNYTILKHAQKYL
jgi:hypothetical protein